MRSAGAAIRTGLGLLALLLSASAAVAQQPPLERARGLYDAGQLAEARVVLVELIKQQPGEVGAHLLLGVIDRTNGDLPASIQSLERAHALAPASTQVTVELATTLAWHNELDRAITLYQQALAVEPSHAGALIGMGFALAWKGQLEQARTIFSELTNAQPASVDAWTGLGFVNRAALLRADAIAAYQRVLTLQPQNKDAVTALEELRWDRRTDIRAFGGVSSIPNGTTEGQGRFDVTHALTPEVTIGGGYQHYAFGAVLAIGGIPETEARTEDSVEGTVTWRPSSRFTLGNSLYTFFSDGMTRGLLWQEGVFALSKRVSIIGNFRPAFSNQEPHWLMAGAAGASVALTARTRITAKALFAANTTYEPRLTLLADAVSAFSRRGQVQLSVANSSSDEQYAFTSVAVTGQWLLTPSLGLTAIASHRSQTFERSEVMVGIVVRR